MPHWSTYLKPHERALLGESEEWLHRPPGTWSRIMEKVDRPLEYAYSKVPESVKANVGKAIHGVLHRLMTGSEGTVPEHTVRDRLCEAAGREISRLRDVRRVDVRVLDKVAHKSTLFHRRAAAFEGGASGFAGIAGMVLDVPALYGILFRMLQEISLIYGFPVHTDEEKAHLLKVLDVGHRTEGEARRAGMREIEEVQSMLHAGVPMREIEKQVILRSLQALAEKLGLHLTQRKLAQTVAVLGSLVGAGVNWQLVGDLGETACHAYRRRFLMELAFEREALEANRSYPTRPLP